MSRNDLNNNWLIFFGPNFSKQGDTQGGEIQNLGSRGKGIKSTFDFQS